MKIDAPSAGAKSAIDFFAFLQMLVCPVDGETAKKNPKMQNTWRV